jgi:hypothetical protein
VGCGIETISRDQTEMTEAIKLFDILKLMDSIVGRVSAPAIIAIILPRRLLADTEIGPT